MRFNSAYQISEAHTQQTDWFFFSFFERDHIERIKKDFPKSKFFYIYILYDDEHSSDSTSTGSRMETGGTYPTSIFYVCVIKYTEVIREGSPSKCPTYEYYTFEKQSKNELF